MDFRPIKSKTLQNTYAETVTGLAEAEDKFDSSTILSDDGPIFTTLAEDHAEPTESEKTLPAVFEGTKKFSLQFQRTEPEFISPGDVMRRIAVQRCYACNNNSAMRECNTSSMMLCMCYQLHDAIFFDGSPAMLCVCYQFCGA